MAATRSRGLGRGVLLPASFGRQGACLWYRPHQTFGIEIELTRSDYESSSRRTFAGVAEHIRRSLSARLDAPVSPRRADGEKSHRHWNVEEDQSAGWEISSRVLAGLDGFHEVAWALDGLSEISQRSALEVGPKTGVHIHLGWVPRDHRQVKRFIRLVKLLEPALATIVTPSRLVRSRRGRYDLSEPNRYCMPISVVFPRDMMPQLRTMAHIMREATSQRHVTVNLENLLTLGTVEVRLLGGTLSADVVLMWLSLWQQILWAAARSSPRITTCPPDVDVLVPAGDILAMVRAYLPRLGQEQFLARLDARRRQMAALWRRHADLSPWKEFSRTWERRE